MLLFDSDLTITFPFLIREANQCHINDPRRSLFVCAAQDLLLLDKQKTIQFIQGIQDPDLMFYAVSSRCKSRFPSQKFMKFLKKEIDRFKDTPNYALLSMHYDEGVEHLALYKKSLINNRK